MFGTDIPLFQKNKGDYMSSMDNADENILPHATLYILLF